MPEAPHPAAVVSPNTTPPTAIPCQWEPAKWRKPRSERRGGDSPLPVGEVELDDGLGAGLAVANLHLLELVFALDLLEVLRVEPLEDFTLGIVSVGMNKA